MFLLGKVEIDNYFDMPNMQRFHTSLNLQQSNEWVQVFRAGDWTNSYKNFKVSPSELDQFVSNFDKNVLETENGEVQFNYSHNSHERAAGWITNLRRNGDTLEALVRWTKSGQEAIEGEEFKYVSAELAFVYKDEETGAETKNVLTGAALTNIPFVRGMKAVALSDDNESKPKEFLYLHNPNNMDAFKVMLSALQGKDAVSLDEAEVLNKMFATLSETEQEEVKEEVEAIEPTEEKEEETVEEVIEEKEEEEASLAQESASVELAEAKAQAAELQAELSAKQAELDKRDLELRTKDVEAKLDSLVSKGIILSKQVEASKALALSLSKDKQAKFFEILNLGEPVVELNSEIGSSTASEKNVDFDSLRSQAQELAKTNGTTMRSEYAKLCQSL